MIIDKNNLDNINLGEKLFTISSEDELKFILTNLNKINNIMKKVSIEKEDGDSESYEINEYNGISYDNANINFILIDFSFESYLFNKEYTPRSVIIEDIIFNKKEQVLVENMNNLLNGEELNMLIDNCKELYSFIKDYKTLVNSIDVYSNNVVFNLKNHLCGLFARVNEDFLEEDSIIIDDEISVDVVIDKDNNPDFFDLFLKKKGTFTLYINTETEEVFLDDNSLNDNPDVCKLIISHKYITGSSGMKINKSSITFHVSSVKDSDSILLYEIIYNVNDKMKVTNSYVAII